MTASSSFSSSSSSSYGNFNMQGMSYAQFSPGLGQVAQDLDTGKLGKELLSNALSAAGVQGFSAYGSSSLSASGSSTVNVMMPKQIETTRMVMVPTEKKVMVPTTRQVPDLQNAGKLESKGSEVTTPGGYKVKLEGDTAYVTAPNGKQIKVWGDPHIEHSDGKGGKQNIDFRKGTTSFMLPDGTRLTMNAYDANGKLAANGMLGKVDIYNGNKHVELNNGREQTGKTGGVTSSGVQSDGYAKAAAQDAGDVLHVVGDGSQLAHKGKLTQHESVSGTVRKGEWATGAAATSSGVGAQAVQIPMKTVTDFKEVTVQGFEQKLIKESKTVWENVAYSATFGGGASATHAAGATGSATSSASAWGASSSVSHNAFAVNGGYGGFGTGNWGDHSLSNVGGAMGGCGLYGGSVNSGGSYYGSIGQGNQSTNWGAGSTTGFPAQNIASYVSGAAGGAASVLNSYNQSANALSQSSMASRFGSMQRPAAPNSGMMPVDWTPDNHVHRQGDMGQGTTWSTDLRTKGGGPSGVDWKEVTEKKTITEWQTVTEARPVEKVRDIPPKQATAQILFENAVPRPGDDLTKVKPQDVNSARSALSNISADDLRKPGASIDISAFASARGNSAGYNNQALTDRRSQYTANAFREALKEKGLSDPEINNLLKTSAHGSTQAKQPEQASIGVQQPDRRTDVTINIPGAQEKYTDMETVTKQVPVQREIEVKKRVPVERPAQPFSVAADHNVNAPGLSASGHSEIRMNADGTWTIT